MESKNNFWINVEHNIIAIGCVGLGILGLFGCKDSIVSGDSDELAEGAMLLTVGISGGISNECFRSYRLHKENSNKEESEK